MTSDKQEDAFTRHLSLITCHCFMDHEQQIDDLFHSALERAPSARAAFLNEACDGDEELRREVESLLAYYEQASDFIEKPVALAAAHLLADHQTRSLVGQQIGHYKILSPLGAGGMGEVYQAEDTMLKRRVAIKVLPAHFPAEEDRVRRFEQEARAVSALNHPNILTIYEIGQTDSAHFIATEFIDGVTLREHMSSTRISTSEALDVAAQVASALAAAHEEGVIHRDIKPENIMLRRRDAIVKVLDFGIAKLTERRRPMSNSEASTKAIVRTEPGVVMGTVSYMSPEQARGLQVDARTDLWSLGCILYEMVAGRVPFEGPTPSDVIVSILEKEPPSLTQYSREAPEAVEAIVTKALRKDTEERYQTAHELLTDLRQLTQRLEFEAELERSSPPEMSGAHATVEAIRESASQTSRSAATRPTSSAEYLIREVKRHKQSVLLALVTLILTAAAIAYFARGDQPIDSVAVLPFINVSADPNTEYLSEGISDSIANSLSQLPKLRVVPSSTVSRYKDREVDPQAVGRELGVRAVLTGRVMQRGESLNIRMELVDVANVSRLWGKQYNRQISDILQVQEEIAEEISEKLRLRLSGEEKKQLTKRYTENTEAYQLYLKGRHFWNKRTQADLKKGIAYFEQAIAMDPTYALAYAGLADSYGVTGFAEYAALPPREAAQKAEAAALKALELDDTLAEAHTSLARVKMLSWDWSGAEAEYKRAIELNPNYAPAYQFYALDLASVGRQDEALMAIKRAQELEPLSLIINAAVGRQLYFARRYDQAIEQLRKTLELDPNFTVAHIRLGRAFVQKGMYEEAITEFEKALALSGDVPVSVAALGYAYAVSGKRAKAQELIDELKELSKRRYVSSYYIATIYSGLGERDQAFHWLQKAYEDHEGSLAHIRPEPMFDPIRSDPRFADLVRRMGIMP